MEQDPLAALRPIHTPPPVSWWPPAPGWWIVLALILLSAGAAVFWWLRRTRYRRAALRELRALEAAEASVAGINRLLKRYALVCFPCADVASLTGYAWISFLNDHGPGASDKRFTGRIAQTLLEAPYRDGTKADDALIACTRAWLRCNRPGRHANANSGETR